MYAYVYNYVYNLIYLIYKVYLKRYSYVCDDNDNATHIDIIVLSAICEITIV